MHVMTKAERLADKKLVEQAKELEANDSSGNLQWWDLHGTENF